MEKENESSPAILILTNKHNTNSRNKDTENDTKTNMKDKAKITINIIKRVTNTTLPTIQEPEAESTTLNKDSTKEDIVDVDRPSTVTWIGE